MTGGIMCYIIKRNKRSRRGGSVMAEKHKIYNVLDIARYVINYYNDACVEISNLKLQKLLYYIQATFLVEQNRECFEDKIVNWSYGPVIENVYMEYRSYGYANIPKQNSYVKIIYDSEKNEMRYATIEFNKDIIDDNDIKLIDKSIKSYMSYEPFCLVKKTHEEDPWKSSNQNDEITAENIKKYYSQHPENIYGEESKE